MFLAELIILLSGTLYLAISGVLYIASRESRYSWQRTLYLTVFWPFAAMYDPWRRRHIAECIQVPEVEPYQNWRRTWHDDKIDG